MNSQTSGRTKAETNRSAGANTQRFAPNDAFEATRILGQAKALAVRFTITLIHDVPSPAMPVSLLKAAAMSGVPGAGSDLGGIAAIESLALMQQDDIVARLDLIDKMRRPEHANAFVRNKARTCLRISARTLTSSPTVGSSSKSMRG